MASTPILKHHFAALSIPLFLTACVSGGQISSRDSDHTLDSEADTEVNESDMSTDVDTSASTDTDPYVESDAGIDTEEDTGNDTSSEEDTETAEEPDKTILKVFILAGQSNMVGKGTVVTTQDHIDKNGGLGTLEYLVNDPSAKPTYDHLVNQDGAWVVRDDVWVADLEKSGPLSVEGKSSFGPDLQFAFVMGEYYENPVLIIKTAWGGKSLYVDFRPPSSGEEVGPNYTMMVERVHEVLGNIKEHVPGYQGQGYEIAGFGWHQGWNDRVNQTYNDAYQVNCVNLINDLRSEFNLPQLPFVLATTGMSGWRESHPRACSLMAAQLAVPDDPGLENGNVVSVDTRDYYRPEELSPAGANQGFHWHWNAETLFLIGNGMAEAMITLLGDGDGIEDECPNDPAKIKRGKCGCNTPETDSDNDGIPNCLDDEPEDPPPAPQCV